MIVRTMWLLVFMTLSNLCLAQATEVHFLSGTDKDHTVDWQFRVSGGRNSGEWTSIPVPSNWEMQGFGTYRYWSDWDGGLAPDREGQYRYTFSVPSDWQGRAIEIVFGGVMTDTEVHLNGELVGPVHRGGSYEFRYDIDKHLRYGADNLLEVKVTRFSADKSINLAERRADFWMFSGIYRPVWLELKPSEHIERIALNAAHDGEFQAQVLLDGIEGADSVEGHITTLDGKRIGRRFSAAVAPGQREVILAARLRDVRPWSAEDPYRYKVVVELKRGRKSLHQVEETFGFRTVEVRPRDGFYINGRKIRLKGVNRHSFWPDSGRTTSEAISRSDIELIKSMNMNAVRVGHAPPDRHFLKVADELGIYVINELTGWQDAYNTDVGRPLVREMITRDHNHPSIIIWANGNEGGWNLELDADFRHWDRQKRPVIHPWALFGGIDTSHYETYDCCASSLFGGSELFMPTEFLHGLYDGGAAAGLDDWWNRMLRHPLAVGGFIWAFADEGIVRDDQGGAIDTAGNSAPDGILGPYREKEGSFYAVREIWSPVYFPQGELSYLPEQFDGNLRVENRYDFTDLNDVKFNWELWQFPNPHDSDATHEVISQGSAKTGEIAPGQSGNLALKLPKNWRTNHALALSATDSHGRLIHTWTWMIASPADTARRMFGENHGVVEAENNATHIQLRSEDLTLLIDKRNGRLAEVMRGEQRLSLDNGPRLVEGESKVENVSLDWEGNTPVVNIRYQGELRRTQWRLHSNGWLQINYAYGLPPKHQARYMGVTFDYPEEKVKSVRWLGRGPYRVWKNRLKGMTHNVWQNNYNDAITGQSWTYPEFKGFFRDFHWATLETTELPITLATSNNNTFLRLFTPAQASSPMATQVDFPTGDISLLQGIAPIGTKFHSAEAHGIQGSLNRAGRLGQWHEGEMYLFFGTLPN